MENVNILNLNKVSTKNVDVEMQGLACISGYTIRTTKAGSPYIIGTLQYQDITVSLKVWNKEVIEVIQAQKKESFLAYLGGTVTQYNGAVEYTCNYIDMGKVPEGIGVNVFKSRLDITKLQQDFKVYVGQILTSRSKKLYTAVMGVEIGGKTLGEMFEVEYAATRHHDNQPGGLMHHTKKMLSILDVLYYNDTRIAKDMEVLRLGILLHDIGKTVEMSEGVYTKIGSYLGHTAIGEEYLIKVLNENPEIKEEWKDTEIWRLRAIIRGHHGEYGEPCKTVDSYIIHLIDMLEAEITGIYDMKQNKSAIKVNEVTGVKSIYYRDRYLTI